MKKKIFFIAGLITLIYLVMGYTNDFLAYKAPYGIPQFQSLHLQNKNSIDVLFVGSSHVYSDINPAIIWEETGIASFDAATGGAALWNSYYTIKEALKTQRPKLIVLELHGSSKGEIADREVMDANWGIGNPFTRWEAIKVSTTEDKSLDFMMEYPYYHTRYQDVEKIDFEPYTHNYAVGSQKFFLYPENNKASYKGAVSLSHITKYSELNNIENKGEISEINEKSELYLEKIIELSKSEGIPLMFIVSPYMDYNEKVQKRHNYIAKKAEENHVEFIDFNSPAMLAELGLDARTDFAERSHLSYKGMKKFSVYLGNYLSEHYDLPDRRGQDGYRSWDENAEWEKQVYYNFDMANINNINEYLEKINNDRYFVVVSFNNVSREDLEDIDISEITDQTDISNCVVLKDYENNNTIVLDGKNMNEYHTDLGSVSFSVSIKNGKPTIMLDREIYKKVPKGVDFIVYDRYVDTLVDVVGFDAAKEFGRIR